MKKAIIFFLIIASLFLAACGQDITTQKLQGRTILLSTPDIRLDPLQSQDIYLGVNNIFENDEKFEIMLECTVVDCNKYVLAQTFPSIGIAAGKMGAFPIRVMAMEGAIPGLYPFQITVKHGNTIHGTATLTVEMTSELEEKKKELAERLSQ